MKWRMLKTFLNTWLHVEEGTARVREWAMEKAIATAPDFLTFSDFLQSYFNRRGFKVTVKMDYGSASGEELH